jgi:hypothetical protein
MDMVFNLMWMALGAFLGVIVMALCVIASDERDKR